MKPVLKTFLIVSAITSALTISSCSSLTPTAKSTNTPVATPTRNAGVLGTQVCIVNNSAMSLRIFWRGYPDARDIPPGGQNCNSGNEARGWGNKLSDVAGRLDYEPTAYPGTWLSLKLTGDNEAFEAPAFYLWYTSNNAMYGLHAGFDIGMTKTMQTDWIAASVTREADSPDNKEFVLTITDAIIGQNHAEELIKAGSGW